MSKPKVYQTTVYIGTINGQKKYKHLRANSQKELNSKVTAIKNAVAAGKDVYTNPLFGVWAAKWFNECKQPAGLNEGTLADYQSAINHLNRYFEFVELKKIKLADFQAFINELAENNPNTGKPTSKSTLRKINITAAAICRYAASNDIAGAPQFFKDVLIPKTAPKSSRRALTEFEQQMIIDTPHRCQPAAMIMLFSGLRRGELIPLCWSDVDLSSGTISVNKSVDLHAKTARIKEGGKTANAVRVVAIPPILVNYLIEYKKSCKILTPYVIYNAAGKLHTASSFRQMWDSYLTDLNVKYGFNNDVSKYNPNGLPMRIEHFTPHYLRHTYATMLYLQGVDIMTAKQYLGHADIQTTANIYTDLQHNSKLTISNNYKKLLQTDYRIATA